MCISAVSFLISQPILQESTLARQPSVACTANWPEVLCISSQGQVPTHLQAEGGMWGFNEEKTIIWLTESVSNQVDSSIRNER